MTSDMMVLQPYMVTVVIIGGGRGLRNEVHCRNQPNKSGWISTVFHFKRCFKQPYINNKKERFNYKGAWVWCVCGYCIPIMCLKEELAQATDKQLQVIKTIKRYLKNS